MSYAKVIILKRPGHFDAPLTYKIPSAWNSENLIGQGVSVELRGKKSRGIVVQVEENLSEEIKKVHEILELLPELRLTPQALQLAQKMSDYYRCSLLRTLKLMLPGLLWKGKGKRILAQKKEKYSKKPDPSVFPLQFFEHELTSKQQQVLKGLCNEVRPVLLHGVTGSGKTELYLRLILETVKKGKQAILLVPEIALTPQMKAYFEHYFGDHMALFHSRLSEGQRLSEWLKVQSGYAPLVIGSRSAIFAPVTDVGVLILDEEHEWTYKQESSPYYQTHYVAEMMKEITGCQLVFGSATPRMESYYKARTGEYSYLSLPERVRATPLPRVEVVDLREEFKQKNFSIFSHKLFHKIQDRLSKKEQIILFVNQRGLARAVVCRDCGQSLTCPVCEVSLKLHGSSHGESYLLCHYCSYRTEPELSCPHCGSVNIRHAGLGTQRVEEELLKSFPGVRIIRADKDTTSDKQGFEPIYDSFKKGDYDVLVGTQMVAKGLDFPQVTLIGIMLADVGLYIPDFRSHERLFQLITQVAGRAGRGEEEGEVVLQTYQPEHHAIQMAARYQYEAFTQKELDFRRRLNYPPFGRIIKFVVTGFDLSKLMELVQQEVEVLEDIFKVNQLEAKVSWAPAMIAKIGPQYYYHVLLRSEHPHSVFKHWKVPAGWRVDVDPINTV